MRRDSRRWLQDPIRFAIAMAGTLDYIALGAALVALLDSRRFTACGATRWDAYGGYAFSIAESTSNSVFYGVYTNGASGNVSAICRELDHGSVNEIVDSGVQAPVGGWIGWCISEAPSGADQVLKLSVNGGAPSSVTYPYATGVTQAGSNLEVELGRLGRLSVAGYLTGRFGWQAALGTDVSDLQMRALSNLAVGYRMVRPGAPGGLFVPKRDQAYWVDPVKGALQATAPTLFSAADASIADHGTMQGSLNSSDLVEDWQVAA